MGNVDEKEVSSMQQEVEKKMIIREAITFFRTNMAHIEIVREDQVQKIYFPVLPFCKYLSKNLRSEFNESVVRTSTKTKLADLMDASQMLIKNMKHEEKLSILFNKYKVVGLFANHVRLWEFASFYIGIFLNIIIISSYSDDNPDRLLEPRLFGDKSITNTESIITTFGILNMIFSGLVVVNFYMRKAPILLGDLWIKFYAKKFQLLKTPLRLVVVIVKSLLRALQDFDILYYSLVIFFALFGLLVHPFFFFFQLTDFLRIELLRNVIKAIWIPRK
mmetsp:Transcript_20239/g.17444  ORF Transcript_20239/g.17444 Transcript_20239/m.17444 type:complete len:276 (+) Transcript_20239:842-1669(+)